MSRRSYVQSNHFRIILVLLLAADFVFLGLYALYGFDLIHDPKFGLIEDWSYGEVYQYIKEFWIVILLGIAAVRFRGATFIAWGLVFIYLLLDDSLMFHERGGAALAEWLSLPSSGNLRSVDFGELIVTAVAGTLSILFVSLAYLRADQPTRRFSQILLLLLIGLIIFGVGLDMIRFTEPELLAKAVGALEDAGEMFLMSVIVWYVFCTASSDNPLRNHTDSDWAESA